MVAYKLLNNFAYSKRSFVTYNYRAGNAMVYARISNPKKAATLIASMLIHLLLMVVLGLSFQDTPRNSLNKDFDLYAIKLHNLEPKSKDAVSSKGDKKSGKKIRKKKSNKPVRQKGTRQALAPKTKLESLKKKANTQIEKKNTRLSKVTAQERQKLDKTTKMAKIDHIKRQLELKQKLVSSRPKVLAKLEKPSVLKKYTQNSKLFNKKQINPLKTSNKQSAKAQTQKPVDKLRRTQKVTPIDRPSKVKMDLAKLKEFKPQNEREVKLAKLTLNRQRNRITDRINYQQKELSSKPVEVKRQVNYNTKSGQLIRKTINANKFLNKTTQTITEIKQVETFTRMVKKTTYVTKTDSPTVLRSSLALKPIQNNSVQKQLQLAKLSAEVSPKTQLQRTVSYQQKLTQSKPVEFKQQRVIYQQQLQPVKRAVSRPLDLQVAATTQFQTAQTQTLATISRQSTSSDIKPLTNLAVLTGNVALEPVETRSIQKQFQLVRVSADVSPKNELQRVVSFQHRKSQWEPVNLNQQRVAYQQQSQTVNRTVSGPAALDVAATTQLQTAQTQTLETISRQSTSSDYASMTDMAALTGDLALEPAQEQTIQKQFQVAKLSADVSPKTQLQRVVSYQQTQTQTQWKPVDVNQQRVAYQQQSQTVVNRTVSGPAALDVAATTQLQTAQTQTLETISRQSTSSDYVPVNNITVLNSRNIDEVPQREFSHKQVQVAKLESTNEKFVVTRRVKFAPRSASMKSTNIIQQRVAYQQTSQEVDKKSVDQSTNLIDMGTVVQMDKAANPPATETQVATINRQKRATSISTSPDSFVLETQHYATQERPTFDYDKARGGVELSASTLHQSKTIDQERNLTLAYSAQDKSRAKVAVSTSARAVSSSRNSSPNSPLLSSNGQASAGEKNAPVIKAKLPSGNTTSDTLYRLRGEISGGVKQAFITINDVTQLVKVMNGNFEVEIALVKGVNEISILAFDASGGLGKQSLKLLYNPPVGVPVVKLVEPRNGKQGVKEGDPIIVSGTIDDNSITHATLYLNGIPIKMKVVNGIFKKKIFMPNSRVTTFRVMAQPKNSPPGYSALHTVLSGYDIDITNPRPY
jgi:hypothetical protein